VRERAAVLCNGLVRLALPVFLIASLATAQPPRFQSADIHLSKDIRESRGRFLPNGDVAVLNTTLKELITVAYEAQEGTIAGVSGWMETEHYDLIAKAPPNTPMNTLRLMLRPLVAERFQLVVHTEQRVMPVLALVVAKRAATLKPSAIAGSETCRWTGTAPDHLQRECRYLTMADLALQLPAWTKTKLSRPVVDLSGLKGAYDFTLNWREPGTTVPDALDQIGLKLEERQHAMPVIVVDRAVRPGAGK
jgi:uncharacterized protein (TIGR03435 family)